MTVIPPSEGEQAYPPGPISFLPPAAVPYPPPTTEPVLPPPPQQPTQPLALQWQRLHPATPWLRGWAVLVAIVGLLINRMWNDLRQAIDSGGAQVLMLILVIVILILGVVGAYNFIWWRMAKFCIGTETVELYTGILSRRYRKLRLDQLEAVDVVRPVVARIFGLAELKLEAAGGADSNLTLTYLTTAHAEAVRAEVLQRKLGASPESAPKAATNLPQTAPQLFKVPRAWTIKSYLLSSNPWVTGASTAVVIVISSVFDLWGGYVLMLPLLFGMVRTFWTYLITEMDFTGFVHPNGIHLTHGLATRVNQSIPANRIQAIQLRQRLLWRSHDWWRVELNVAGYGNETSNRALLVPVADPHMAAIAMSSIMPEVTTAEIWAIIDQAMHGTCSPPHFIGSPKRVRLFNPITWKHQGYATTPYAIVIRTGRIAKRVIIIPHDRILGVSIFGGPLERHLGLASAVLHSSPGPVSAGIPHLDSADMERLLSAELRTIERQ
ncbi:MAG: PH domain-containing protein [Propionibacteriaceae bacterium]|nr:PH domain-containing protein [Propionibacteriaceae bacterium]